MQWPQWQRKTTTVEKIVVVHDSDARPRQAKWVDKGYLTQLRSLGTNNSFTTEVMYALEALRDQADKAETPDQLKGYREAIKIVKELAISPVMAGAQLQNIEIAERSEDV